MSARPGRGDSSQPIPTGDVDGAELTTARAVWHIHARYVLLVVSVNLLIAIVVVAYELYDAQHTTAVFLAESADRVTYLVRVLRRESAESDRRVIDRAHHLTSFEMALLDTHGRVYHQTNDGIAPQLARMGWPGDSPEVPSSRMLIDSSLGELSGSWSLGSYSEAYNLLVIVPRRPEDEGAVQYVTVAAGISLVGLLATIAIMLAGASWMLKRPLAQLIETLTGALVRDVQRRREAEERAVSARLDAERHLRFLDDLLDASEEVAIVGTDENATVRIFNRAAERILGVRAEEVTGRMSLTMLRAAIEPSGESAGQSLRPFLKHTDGENHIVDALGKERIIQLTTSAIMGSAGKPAGTLLIFFDITEQRRLEGELTLKHMQLIQSSKMATLGEMATGIAHEINQPLNNIGLLASRVERRIGGKQALATEDASFVLDRLTTIREQIDRAAKIIDQLRVFGRSMPSAVTDVDAREAVRGALDLLGEQFRLHDIAVDVDLPEALPRVRGDLPRLEQVLINLVVNARDALDEHAERLRAEGKRESYQKRLSVRCLRAMLEDGRTAVAIEVEDNGPGMTPEISSRIFEPFFTTKEVGKGTGLGLSISYGIVREFGGTLTVRTKPGEGTTFTVSLEQAPAEGSA